MSAKPLTLVSSAAGRCDTAIESVLGTLGFAPRFTSPERLADDGGTAPGDPVVLVLGASPVSSAVLSHALGALSRVPSLALVVRGEGRWDRQIIDACCDCALWPCSRDELAYRLERLCSARGQAEQELLDPVLGRTLMNLNLIGRSPAFVRAMGSLERMVPSDAPVLLYGETGTGKELAARALHYLGQRAGGPFVPVNCGALPDHLVENELFGHERGAFTDARASAPGAIGEADGGTLFLDEVETLSPKAQAALLRFLQDREYRPLGASRPRRADTRVVAASNVDLRALSAQRAFRADLFHRLDILSTTLPPLRRRAGDVTLLARHFVDAFAGRYGRRPLVLDPRCLPLLERYPWPGNIRELENLVHRGVLLARTDRLFLQPGHEEACADQRPEGPSALAPFAEAKAQAIERFEREYLTRLLEESGGNVSQAARRAAKERRALGKLLKKHRIRC